MPRLSVVIPTHNRKDILLMALRAYGSQMPPKGDAELLVVDDGSTDGTGEALARAPLGRQPWLRYISQPCRGQAAARNHGIRESRGDIILFTDDDIIPCPDLVAEHLTWHGRHREPSAGILGHVAWSRDVNPTPFMEWLGQDGVVFAYGHIRGGQELRHGYFYSSNISLKRKFLVENGLFDEDFSSYGCEDVELGERLMRKGLCLFYNRQALGYHHKRMSVADVWRRAELVDRSRQLLRAKSQDPHPARKRGLARTALRGLLRATLPPLAPVIRLFDTRLPLPWVVYRAFYFHYILPKVRATLGAPTD
ncbi:MAG TPA: glycosyltransferase [Candidatus Dormibacteraeota bacterium]|nr:glycosyltransferase [Candidatus Dormibacteraeota bacterium]